MNRATTEIQSLALRLMTHQTKGKLSSEDIAVESFLVFEKLRPQVASLMGNGGFRALLTRAHALAKAEVPWLSMVRVGADGTLEATGGLGARVTTQQLVEGSSVLLAQLFGLMVAFIGEKLTLGLIREVWPKIHISAAEFDDKDTHENKN